MSIILIDANTPSGAVLAGSPGANREHFIQGGVITKDADGRLELGPLSLYQGASWHNPDDPIPCGKGQPITLTFAAGNVGGFIDVLTR